MKKILKIALIGIGCIVLWIGLVEALIRIFFPQPAIFHQLDPILGYVGIPGKSGWYINPSDDEFRVYLQMNKYGFRDVDHEMEKPANTYRILFFGDSFTEAKEVDLEKTYWRLLQAGMPALPDGRHVEVLNMAISGYSNAQELLMLQTRGLAFKPDLVVVAMTEFSDVWNNSQYLDCLSDGRDPANPIKPYFHIDGDTLRLGSFKLNRMDESGFRLFRRNFQTYMYIRNLAVANPTLMRLAWRLRLVATPPTPPKLARAYPMYFDSWRADQDQDTKWIEAYEITKRLMLEFRKTCDANATKLLVMIISSPDQIYPWYRENSENRFPAMRQTTFEWTRPGRIMNEFLTAEGIPTLYFYPLLMEEAKRRPNDCLFFIRDLHFNPDGHRFVAEHLRSKITEMAGGG